MLTEWKDISNEHAFNLFLKSVHGINAMWLSENAAVPAEEHGK